MAVQPSSCRTGSPAVGEGVKTRLKEHLMEEAQPLHHRAAFLIVCSSPMQSIGTNLLFFEKGEPTKNISRWTYILSRKRKKHTP